MLSWVWSHGKGRPLKKKGRYLREKRAWSQKFSGAFSSGSPRIPCHHIPCIRAWLLKRNFRSTILPLEFSQTLKLQCSQNFSWLEDVMSPEFLVISIKSDRPLLDTMLRTYRLWFSWKLFKCRLNSLEIVTVFSFLENVSWINEKGGKHFNSKNVDDFSEIRWLGFSKIAQVCKFSSAPVKTIVGNVDTAALQYNLFF